MTLLFCLLAAVALLCAAAGAFVLVVCTCGHQIKVGKKTLGMLKGRYEMGRIDKWYAASHAARCVVGFSLIVEAQWEGSLSRRPPLIQAMTRALRSLVLMHEGLQYTYVTNDNGTIPGETNVLVPVQWTQQQYRNAIVEIFTELPEEWDTVVEDDMRTPFTVPATLKEAKDPASTHLSLLLRVGAYHGSDGTTHFLFTFHHAACDGVSAAHLTTKFLQLLQDEVVQNPGESYLLRQRQQPYPVCFPAEHYFDLRPTLFDVATAVLYDRVPSLKKRKDYAGPAVPVPPERRRSMNEYLVVEPTELARLTAFSRANGITLHFLLQAAMQAAAVTVIQARSQRQQPQEDHGNGAQSKDSDLESLARSLAWTDGCAAAAYRQFLKGACPLQTGYPVNLRRRAVPEPVPVASMRTVLAGTQQPLTLSPRTRLVALASHLQRQQEAVLAKSISRFGLLQFLVGAYSAFFQRFQRKPPNGRDGFVELSNLGKVPLPADVAGFRLQRVYFANAKAAEGPLVMARAVTGVAMVGRYDTGSEPTVWPPRTASSTVARSLGLTVSFGAPLPLLERRDLALFKRAVATAIRHPEESLSTLAALALK